MHPSTRSFSNPGSVAASVDSLASIPGIRDVSAGVTHGSDLLAQGSPHSFNSTSASSLSSSGSLPIHQQHPGSDSFLGLVHRNHNVDNALYSGSPSNRAQGRNHSRTHSSNSHHSLAMTSRTPSESNSQYPYIPPPPFFHSHGKSSSGTLQSDSVASSATTTDMRGHPTIHTNTTPLPQSQGSNYLSSPNDTIDGQGADSPVGVIPSNWASPPMRPYGHPVVSTSIGSNTTGGLTSPASLSSPVHLNQPSPTSQHQSYPLPSQFLPSGQQQQENQQSQQQSQQPPAQKPKKEKHSFGGMSASSFLTETLPTGMKLYSGSKKNAKSQGDISSSSSSTHNGKGKKSGSGGPLSSISTRKQQLSPGGHSSSTIDRAYSSNSNITSPVSGGVPHHHHTTSPTLGKNNHSSLDAKVMAREMAQSHATEDVWQALCIKVLTLFNGQGLTGAIEDLNDLVRKCLQTRSLHTLCDEISELLNNGMLTLNAKLGDVPDEKLVSRLVEVWSFFFGTVLPYFEGVFLPLQIQLKKAHAEKTAWRATGGSSSGISGGLTLSLSNNGVSSSGLSTMSTISIGGMESNSASGIVGASPKSIAADAERKYEDSEPQNVRTMALTGFRDLVILPMVDRLGGVFAKLFMDFDASIPVTDTASRMLQMTSVLTSIQSGDAQQLLMEQVSNRLKTNWKQFTRRGNRGGFVGLDRRIAPAQQAR
ncbi:HbrB-like-domain-containing protein [Gamsiella multidivaricata]|uniref:HbrB-like-domain-containing protein n=1 Tax=Gamsiella multidivaricata TaxID=101098 RepID=UPI0022205825|nr:HbrB-like-domain-containing protein [Gamsiella multidivaricata]KAG0359498.1 hypothetical protein BGZ54_009930 [Gamsiella multidivaricata]KAI7831309.1 HbrB-like-domain-containing protein [Gamsiella multidivaricata]